MTTNPKAPQAVGTLASAAYGRLRQEIIRGTYKAGERLHIGRLCTALDVGLSPVREALNRLSTEGLVQQFDQRGFRVAPLDIEDLADLTQARCWINETAIPAALAAGDQAWEESVVVALYRLKRAPHAIADEIGQRSPEWEAAHRDFHRILIAACGSRRWLNLWEELFDAAERYRFTSRLAATQQRPDMAEHEAIVQAVLARDSPNAVALLNAHVRRTETLFRERLAHE